MAVSQPLNQRHSPPASPTVPSPSSTTSTSRRRSTLSLDFSTLPPLITPSPPTNTLLITNLNDAALFLEPTISSLRDLLSATAPLYAFSPLKSFRRIVATFFTLDDAIRIKQVLDGTVLSGDRVRIFFGAHTNINPSDEEVYLKAPDKGKLFFISPPPSPPIGWESREEEPPNKVVCAEDLAAALTKLRTGFTSGEEPQGHLPSVTTRADPGATGVHPAAAQAIAEDEKANHQRQQQQQQQQQQPYFLPATPTSPSISNGTPRRSRAGTLSVLYDPGEQGHSPDLPAIAVEDFTVEGDDEEVMCGEDEDMGRREIQRTSRPPIELMG